MIQFGYRSILDLSRLLVEFPPHSEVVVIIDQMTVRIEVTSDGAIELSNDSGSLLIQPVVSNSGKPTDLMAILPGDLGNGRVIPVWIATNPETVALLEEELSR